MLGGTHYPETDGLVKAPAAGSEPFFLVVENTAFYTVADIVTEGGNPVQLGRVVLERLKAIGQRTIPGRPSFPVHQYALVLSMQCFRNLIHGRDVVNGHQIKPKAVHVVFPHPVRHRLADEFAHHRSFTGNFVAAAAGVTHSAIVAEAVEVIGDEFLKITVLAAPGVVVNNVHHDPNPGFV